MVDKQQMELAAESMMKSPLFYLFLASKELFHSNFLYWLSLQNQQELAKTVCPEYDGAGPLTIVREKRIAAGNEKAVLDLYIVNRKGEVLILENKVKDYPDDEQLSRISSSVQARDKATFILLSLLPIEGDAFGDWHKLNYGTLSNRIEPERYTEDRYYRDLIADYKAFTRNLAEFANALSFSADYDFAISHDKELFRTLNKYKLWEAYQKMRGSHMVQAYSRRYSHLGVLSTCGINHQKATMDFFVEVVPGKVLGIQIENDQHRKYLSSKTAEVDAMALLNEGIFFRKEFLSPMKKEPFLRYGREFRYQYDQMHGHVSFDILFRSINDELQEGVLNNLDRIAKVL